VAAGRFELPALVGDLAEQPGVLDGQGGLGGEGLEEVQRLRREAPRFPPRHGQRAQNPLLQEEGNARLGYDAMQTVAQYGKPPGMLVERLRRPVARVAVGAGA
jgi:hypothetical protein